MHEHYYEGILQLRNPSEEIIAFVKDFLELHQVHVAKVKKVKGGRDYYLGDSKALLSLGKRLKERFPGEHKTSSTLYSKSRQTGKEVHRLTVLFRHVPFSVGEVVDYRGRQVQINRLGAKVEIKETSSGKRELISYEELLEQAIPSR